MNWYLDGYKLCNATWVSGLPATLSVNPLADFGNVITNSIAGRYTFTITGTNLNGVDNVTVGVLACFTYCTTSGGRYTTTLSFPSAQPANSPSVIPGFSQVIYVNFSPTAVC